MLAAALVTAVRLPASAPAAPAAAHPYRLVERWSPLAAPGSPEWELGGVAVSPDGRRLVLARRVDAPLLDVDPARGVITRQWAQGLIAWSHSLTFDREGNLWVADAAIGSDARTGLNPAAPSAVAAGRGHQVLKIGRDGQVRLALGTAGQPGADASHFNAPTGVAFGAHGDLFVSDGHSGTPNARVVVFDKTGRYLRTWGTKGTGAGQFGEPHGILIDPAGRVLVADRMNGRIAVFTQAGALLAEWKGLGLRPCALALGPGGTLYVSSHDARSHENIVTIARLSDGTPLETIDPALEGIDGLAVDRQGTVYAVSATARAVARYERR